MSVTIDVDLREHLAAARDQGSRPTCLVFAVSAAHEAKRGSTDYLSAEYLFYHGAQRSHKNPEQGLTRDAVRAALVADGQPLEPAWPYSAKPPTRATWTPPSLTEATHKATIEYSPRTVGQVREVIRAGTPVLLLVALTVAIYTPDKNAAVRARAGDVVTTGRHALLAVGAGHADDGQYLLVRNSWGTSWGDAGHAWLHEPYLAPQLQMTGTLI